MASASDIISFSFENNDDEGLLVDKVVQQVRQRIRRPAHELRIPVLTENANGLQQPPESNNYNQQDSGNIASANNNPQDSGNIASANNNQQDSGNIASAGNGDNSQSNPEDSNDIRGYVKNFATIHGQIFAGVASLSTLTLSSAVMKNILFFSALVSVAIIGDFVIKSYKEFRSQNRNLCWVIQRIAVFLLFIVFSVYLLLVYNRLLNPH